MNMKRKAMTSGAHRARVALSWFIVRLKEMYLNNFNQDTNTLMANTTVDISVR